MYLNKADFVNTAVGIRSAANVYFSKEPRDLKVEEAAMLVGMLKNPSLFNPVRRLEKVQNRRNIVLGQMVKNKFLEESDKIALEKKPIALKFKPESHQEGIGNLFSRIPSRFYEKMV